MRRVRYLGFEDRGVGIKGLGFGAWGRGAGFRA